MRTRNLIITSSALCVLGIAPGVSWPLAAAGRTAAAAERAVAVGDLHGDLESSLAVLRMAGVVDAEGHWSAGAATLVQTGDTTDRGPDSRGVLALMARLESEATAAGGTVVALMGNHEVMNLTGDLRYVSAADVAGFGGAEARRAAFSAAGTEGAWLRAHGITARVGDTVFAHGGISARFAALGVDGINAAASAALAGAASADVLGAEGPLWLRDYLLADEAVACPELRRALTALGARRMVVGHTTQRSGRIASRCEGAVLGIDTGISAHYGGHLAALELRPIAEDGVTDAWALYADGAVDLPDPSDQSAPSR